MMKKIGSPSFPWSAAKPTCEIVFKKRGNTPENCRIRPFRTPLKIKKGEYGETPKP